MKAKYEYKEGDKARESFEDAMKWIFKAPKVAIGKASAKKASSRKKAQKPDKVKE